MKRWMFFAGCNCSVCVRRQVRNSTNGARTSSAVVIATAENVPSKWWSMAPPKSRFAAIRESIRNLSGQPAQWRRFECNSPLPSNAANFRFAGVDGRGRQQLIRDPRNGGAAVIRIEDPQGGSEGYTFDITWGGDFNYSPGGGNRLPPADRYPGGGPAASPPNRPSASARMPCGSRRARASADAQSNSATRASTTTPAATIG